METKLFKSGDASGNDSERQRRLSTLREDTSSNSRLVSPRESEVDVQLFFEDHLLTFGEQRHGYFVDLFSGENLSVRNGLQLSIHADSWWRSAREKKVRATLIHNDCSQGSIAIDFSSLTSNFPSIGL